MPKVRTADFLADFREGLAIASEVNIAVYSLRKSGLNETGLEQELETSLGSGTRIKILIDLSQFTTDPWALEELLALRARYRQRLQVKTLLGRGRLLHAKFYLFKGKSQHRLLTGSANWTGPGFLSNLEHGVLAKGPGSHPLLTDAARLFKRLWTLPQSRPVDEGMVRSYKDAWEKRGDTVDKADKRARQALKRLSNRSLKTPRPAPMTRGDRVFLHALPGGLLEELGERLLKGVRRFYDGELRYHPVSGRHVEYPENFWTVTHRPRKLVLEVTVYGNPQDYSVPARIALKPHMSGYSYFQIARRNVLNDALKIVQQAYALKAERKAGKS